jgi:hypothetical protein
VRSGIAASCPRRIRRRFDANGPLTRRGGESGVTRSDYDAPPRRIDESLQWHRCLLQGFITAGDRRSFGSVPSVRQLLATPQRLGRPAIFPLVERARRRCPGISGRQLCPATSQPANQHRIAGSLPSDDGSREGSVHEFSSRERKSNIAFSMRPSDTGKAELLSGISASPDALHPMPSPVRRSTYGNPARNRERLRTAKGSQGTHSSCCVIHPPRRSQ